jgi:MOSC domain-containing protein YiiM
MKLNPGSPLLSLMGTFPRVGRLEWIGLRTQKRVPPAAVNHAEVLADHGIVGDHRTARPGSQRQVTLIQQEHLTAVAALLGCAAISPVLTRRNLVVSGINLLALHDQQFEIGGVLFEGTGLCEPCSRMETNLGAGGYNAMRGHGGITSRVLRGGVIRLGDDVTFAASLG